MTKAVIIGDERWGMKSFLLLEIPQSYLNLSHPTINKVSISFSLTFSKPVLKDRKYLNPFLCYPCRGNMVILMVLFLLLFPAQTVKFSLVCVYFIDVQSIKVIFVMKSGFPIYNITHFLLILSIDYSLDLILT